MNRFKKFGIALLLCFCVFTFVGCANPFSNFFEPSSTSKVDQYLTNNSNNGTNNGNGETGSGNEDSLQNAGSMTEIAEKALQSAVTVFVKANVEEKVLKDGKYEYEEREGYALGSGMVVKTTDKGAFVVTNHHVIDSFYATEPETEGNKTITWENQVYITIDGGVTEHKATILWDSKELDMAILVCEEIKSLPAMPMKDRTIYCDEEDYIKVLEPVVAIGTPIEFGLFNTVTEGTISSINLRNTKIVDENEKTFDVYECLIQHMAPINPGNSGGVLIDMNGNIIGLNTLALSSLNTISFAISIYPAIAVLDKVVENWEGEEATELLNLGFEYHDALIDSISKDLELEYVDFNDAGVCVTKVETECLVEDLKFGDVIKEITTKTGDETNGFNVSTYEINNAHTFIYGHINLLYAKEASVKVLRDGKETTLTINLNTPEAV